VRAGEHSREKIEMESRIPQDIERQVFDVIVIGAGINGAGVARDAAMRGLRVLLLDKGDISSGTTQWATRLIHGGLRYLEHYEFALVRESLRDREALLHIAPHLVKPLGFLVPIYDRNSNGPLIIRLGMNLYDTLSYDKSMARHKMLGRKKVEEREPGLNPEGLKAAAFYYDAQVEYAERVAVENAISARDHGATIVTYANVEHLIIENNDVKGVEFTDVFTGESHEVRAPVTVNVAGPWVDEVLEELQKPGTDKNVGRFMGGTKGSHLIVDPFPGAPKGEALYVEARKDGRPYFIVPWNGRYGRRRQGQEPERRAAAGRRPALHHRGQADHLPEPEPSDHGRGLQEARPEGAEEHVPQDPAAGK
jgi:glycerol-3-phosphate dehydrogenase